MTRLGCFREKRPFTTKYTYIICNPISVTSRPTCWILVQYSAGINPCFYTNTWGEESFSHFIWFTDNGLVWCNLAIWLCGNILIPKPHTAPIHSVTEWLHSSRFDVLSKAEAAADHSKTLSKQAAPSPINNTNCQKKEKLSCTTATGL